MANEVIMPMLGMAQETGIIVSWKKKLGDPVKASDILMEVETDKSTIELEAGHDGFLTSIRAETGTPIPVGQVVAVIASDRNEIEDVLQATPTAAKADEVPALPVEPPSKEAAPEKAEAPVTTAVPVSAPQHPTPRPASGKVLASPRARREAEARGIDLGRLIQLGVPEPIHVADLDKAGAATSARALATSLMRVRVERAPFDAFLAWLSDEAGVEIDSLHIWAAFAAGSLRAATGANYDAEIRVHATRFPETSTVAFINPDLHGLTTLEEDGGDAPATLTVLDLTDTPLTEYRPAGERSLPHLTVANGQDAANLDIYLEFDPGTPTDTTAFEFLKNLADRAHTPLRHLL